MGVLPNRSSRKTMMMKSLIFVALVAAAAQASVQETEFVQEGSGMDSFSAAQSRVESMLEMDTRARRSACVKAADASINNVFKEVKNAQRSLNRLDNGRRCASRNQHLINRAQHTIRLRQRQLNTANANLRKARRARVRWNFSYESLREGSCSVFFRSGAWQAAKRVVNHRSRVVTQSKANLRAAKNNLTVQIRNAKRARLACKCAVKKNVKKQLIQARKLTGDRQKTLLREMMVKCLVAARKKGKGANAAAARCKSLRISAAYSRRLRLFQTKLAAGVAGANCSGGKYRGGGHGINYRGYWYRSLGGASVHGHANGCDNSFRTIPKGCRVNPSAAVNTYMGTTGGAPMCSAPWASATTPSVTPSVAASGPTTKSTTPVAAVSPGRRLASAVLAPPLAPSVCSSSARSKLPCKKTRRSTGTSGLAPRLLQLGRPGASF